jgi:hypothetical protein
MALGTNHVVVGEVPNFVPELWSDEVVASYKSNLVYANLVRVLNHRGKKGDTIRIPTPTRGVASDKSFTGQAQVTLQQHGTDAGIVVSIDKHKEYSRLIEDITDVQALESLRRFYTDDAGYAIATAIDLDLIFEAADAGFDTLVRNADDTIDATSGLDTVYEGDGSAWNQQGSTDISDAGIRTFVKVLDDVDAPMAGRAMVVPTIVKSDLLGLARFTEQAFTGEVAGSNSIRNGLVGDIYGVEVYVTTQMPIVEDSGGNADNILGQMFQRDATLLVEQMGVRVQNQYKQEYLADLMTADAIYGVKNLRPGSIVNFVVPST